MSHSSGPVIPFRPRRSGVVAPEPAIVAKAKRPRGLPPAPGEPTAAQRAWLASGLSQAGGKLPLFDRDGRRVDARTIRSCIERGWAEQWFANPLKPDWLVCRLTTLGRALFIETPET
jgi:hypothetical protein